MAQDHTGTDLAAGALAAELAGAISSKVMRKTTRPICKTLTCSKQACRGPIKTRPETFGLMAIKAMDKAAME